MLNNKNQKGHALQTLLLALGISTVIFLPFIIFDGGYFIYYGDFNVQQIPFYKLAHEAVRSGDIFWSWYTDLGANFIGSYSFYLLFSPFFWLTLPFPTSWIPFFMAPLLILKTGFAAFFAYFYIKRFVRDSRYAVIGSLLYAFSGWMAFNIFFNHFHDVAVFFPLLLLGLEKLVIDDSKVFFAVAVLINALVNYWFFIGEVVFVIIYFIIRLTDKSFRFRLNFLKIVQIAGEAVLGTVGASVALIPSAMVLMGNPRTTADELLTGWDVWLYWHEQRPWAIVQSLFFPPELPARPNFFPDHGAKWSSLSAWIPLFGLSGVLAYFFRQRNDWIKKLLAFCFAAAMIPGLNSLFVLFNQSYYARWFYMPILVMAVATVRALEDAALDFTPFKRSLKWCLIAVLVFAAASGLTPNYDDDGILNFGMAKDPLLMWAYVGFAVCGILITFIVLLKLRHDKHFVTVMGISTAVFTAAFTIFMMASGKNTFERSRFVINTAIKGREVISLPDDGTFARADAYEAMDNILMYWHLPNIQAFHSIVPTSIMEFYPEVGVTRDVGSRPEADFYALRPLLSVRWLFIGVDEEEQEPMPGYHKISEQAGFNIYENENFIPIGFAYDSFVLLDEFSEDYTESYRDNLLLKAVVLEEDAVDRNIDILYPFDSRDLDIGRDALAESSAARAEFTVSNFSRDNFGFSANTNFDEPKFIFFSVPWEKGWTAYINGQPAIIERANLGFMAVRVPAGEVSIRFSYMTPGLTAGMLLTFAASIILLGYTVLVNIRSRKNPLVKEDFDNAIYSGETVRLTVSEYNSLYNKESEANEPDKTEDDKDDLEVH